MNRLARAALAAGLVPVALAALPARVSAAAECVRVVVDYGTFSGAPAGPNTHCTSSPSGATAAEVLAKRSSEVGTAAPRYRGNFLCAIDGYPESGCGDHGTEPYWSLWLWVSGKWVYSSEGVATYTVRDSDKDGHPDPIGFRYHEFETKRQPRANPGYPAPTPSRTTPPASTPRAPGGTGGGGGATTAPPATGGNGGTLGATPAATGGAPRAPGTTAVAGTTGPGAPAATTGPATALAPTAGSPTDAAFPTSSDDGGLPVGTVLALLLALGLGAAALLRLRRSP